MKGLLFLILLGLLVFLTAVPQPARLSGVRPLATNPFLVPTLNLPGRLTSVVMVQLNSSDFSPRQDWSMQSAASVLP